MRNREHRDLFPGALEMMILRTLKRQPLHGYALAQYIKQTSDDLLQIEEGSLYPALQRLLKEELVKAEWGVSSPIAASGFTGSLPQELSIWSERFPVLRRCSTASPACWRRVNYESD